jgi:hypothetical protein
MHDSQSALAIKTRLSDSGTIQLKSTWSFWIGDAVTEYVWGCGTLPLRSHKDK